jgi:archaemetzincin
MSSQAQRIGVIPMGGVPGRVLKVIAAHISGYLNLSPVVLPALAQPDYARDERRLQYDAGVIATRLEAMPFTGVHKTLAVLDVDLFIPIFTHVFGEARQGGRAALVSIFRLGAQPVAAGASPSLMLERAAKVALHELCHLYSLAHCTDEKCLMHFSGDLGDLDRTPFFFCRYCAAFYRTAVSGTAVSRHSSGT